MFVNALVVQNWMFENNLLTFEIFIWYIFAFKLLKMSLDQIYCNSILGDRYLYVVANGKRIEAV